MKTALVTGASRGIGRACAELLAASGYRVVLAARDLEKLNEVAARIRGSGGEALPVIMDMSSNEAIAGAIGEAVKAVGRIDILVNNAGITKDGLAMRMKTADWDSVLSTNLSGAFCAIQQVLPGMMKERWGRIINISSVVALSGNAGQANYAAAKAGLIGLTKSLAQEVGSRNITVNAIAPGYIGTDMTQGLNDELKEKLVAKTPLRRMGTTEDIAHGVKYLASEEAGFITGHVLSINGGLYM